jgi:hypothetical protein
VSGIAFQLNLQADLFATGIAKTKRQLPKTATGAEFGLCFVVPKPHLSAAKLSHFLLFKVLLARTNTNQH